MDIMDIITDITMDIITIIITITDGFTFLGDIGEREEAAADAVDCLS